MVGNRVADGAGDPRRSATTMALICRSDRGRPELKGKWGRVHGWMASNGELLVWLVGGGFGENNKGCRQQEFVNKKHVYTGAELFAKICQVDVSSSRY